MNLKFSISYDGFFFKGSQKQPNEETIENTLLTVFRRININTKIILSGRTDKEVHATGQVFNCAVPSFWNDLDKLKEVLNYNLPNSIKINHIVEVEENFHSRFHARKRDYRYLITNKKTTPFNDRYVTFVDEINEEVLSKAIKEFIGIHNFKYFHKLGSDKENTVREIYNTKFYRYKDLYIFKFTANSYLRSQIRLMVGFLLKINKGDLTMDDLKKQLNLDKQIFNTPAPPNGLYLSKVRY